MSMKRRTTRRALLLLLSRTKLLSEQMVLALAMLNFWIARERGMAMRRGLIVRIGTVHSLPVYHGLYVALTALLPARPALPE